MEFSQIRYFLTVCETLNFTEAANRCSISQPALTMSIKKLEDGLGGKLLERDRQSVELTTLGRSMKDHLASVLRARDTAMSAAQSAVAGKGEVLNIGVSYTVSLDTLARVTRALSHMDQAARVILHDVSMSKHIELLRSGALDLAIIGSRFPPPPNFEFVDLLADRFVLAYAPDHELARKDRIRVSDLPAVPYIDRLRCEFRKDVLNLAASAGLSLNVVVQSEREDWLLHLVQSGLGVSMMCESTARSFQLATKPVEGIELQRSIGVISRHDHKPESAASNFISQIRLG